MIWGYPHFRKPPFAHMKSGKMKVSKKKGYTEMDFPWTKPSSYWGSPHLWKTPIWSLVKYQPPKYQLVIVKHPHVLRFWTFPDKPTNRSGSFSALLRTSRPVLSPTWLRTPRIWPRYRTSRGACPETWTTCKQCDLNPVDWWLVWGLYYPIYLELQQSKNEESL